MIREDILFDGTLLQRQRKCNYSPKIVTHKFSCDFGGLSLQPYRQPHRLKTIPIRSLRLLKAVS